MNQHLGVSIDPLIKLVISNHCLVKTDLMRHHKAWLSFSRNDKVTEVAIICLDVALACTE